MQVTHQLKEKILMHQKTKTIARKSTGTLGIFLGCFLFYLIVRQFQK